MARSYKGIQPKHHRVYTAGEVQLLYGVHRNTVLNWIAEGLRPSDVAGETLFQGKELRRFHAFREAAKRVTLRPGQFLCFGCKSLVTPLPSSLTFSEDNTLPRRASGTCPKCSTMTHKTLNATEYDSLQSAAHSNTTLDSQDDVISSSLSDIVPLRKMESEPLHSCNDKVIHSWQLYAGHLDPKTVAKYLAAIRGFEVFTKGKSFAKVTLEDARSYCDYLVTLSQMPKSGGGISRQTAVQRAGHMAAFLEWLITQPGFRRLNAMLPSYFKMPRKMTSKGFEAQARDYPRWDDVPPMLAAMPVESLLQRRDRAMVALAFMTGLRAAALTSLRLRHLDLEKKVILHNGQEIRAKNGKSFVIDWFEETAALHGYFVEWVQELQLFGLQNSDAVFPSNRDLEAMEAGLEPDHRILEPMRTQAAIEQAFKLATGNRYTPHAARHSIAALGFEVCKTIDRLRAWSQNMGHETPEITLQHYGKLKDAEKRALLRACQTETDQADNDVSLLLKFMCHEIDQSHPGYQRAQHLYRLRVRKWVGANDVVLE